MGAKHFVGLYVQQLLFQVTDMLDIISDSELSHLILVLQAFNDFIHFFIVLHYIIIYAFKKKI